MSPAPPTDPSLARIAASPLYRQLVRERARFAWTLTVTMLVIYFGFILSVAFARDLLARPVGGGTTTVGIVAGVAVIAAGIVLTAVYVRRANRRFDPLTRAIVEQAGE